MSDKVFRKLKRQNGERFAQTIRNYHNGLLQIEGIVDILRHAGRDPEDAERLLPYLMHKLAVNDEEFEPVEPKDPFVLLEQAGYDAFHVTNIEEQNSIKHHYAPGELLCTFNDRSRYKKYHMIHAVKKNVDTIKRGDFRGKEKRDDAYGTSVISIQMLKNGGFISIKNRYNHSVPACDNTFDSNPDNIIEGLSDALKHHFNVDFSAQKSPMPGGFTLVNGKIFKYRRERNNIYYGDQAWVKDGVIHEIDKSKGDALLHLYRFDGQTKTLYKIDDEIDDGFPESFNAYYGGEKSLQIKKGNLYDGEELLIEADGSAITSVSLPKVTNLVKRSFFAMPKLKSLSLPQLKTVSNECFCYLNSLTELNLPQLQTVENCCFNNMNTLTSLSLPQLQTTGDVCFTGMNKLSRLDFPLLQITGKTNFTFMPSLASLTLPKLQTAGESSFRHFNALRDLSLPQLQTAGNYCFNNMGELKSLNLPVLRKTGVECFGTLNNLSNLSLPQLQTAGDCCFSHMRQLISLDLPQIETAGDDCFNTIPLLTNLNLPKLEITGSHCFRVMNSLTDLRLSQLVIAGEDCFIEMPSLTNLSLPKLKEVGNYCFGALNSLSSLCLPKLQTAGRICFTGMRKLTDLDLPRLQMVGHSSFRHLSVLKSLNLSSLQTVGEDSFIGIRNVSQIQALSKDVFPKKLAGLVTLAHQDESFLKQSHAAKFRP